MGEDVVDKGSCGVECVEVRGSGRGDEYDEGGMSPRSVGPDNDFAQVRGVEVADAELEDGLVAVLDVDDLATWLAPSIPNLSFEKTHFEDVRSRQPAELLVHEKQSIRAPPVPRPLEQLQSLLILPN